MAYVTAITDRVLSDVTTPTSKGYFNVADWTRIYDNARLTASLVNIVDDEAYTFPSIGYPTIENIPTVTDFNDLLNAIEIMRSAVSVAGALVEIKDDWISGNGETSPDYSDANLWENTVDVIWNFYGGGVIEVCPTLTEDVTVLNGEKLIYIDCVDTDTFAIHTEGSGAVYII
jgi:hypothetical protein